MYSAEQEGPETGVLTPFHLVHLGGFASRGAAVTMVEATSVLPNGRLSPNDSGLWNDRQMQALTPIMSYIATQGSIPAIQLGHGGRKTSTLAPWLDTSTIQPHLKSHVATNGAAGGWTDDVMAPSAIAYNDETFPHPREMTPNDIEELKEAFRAAVARADKAGAQVVELHCAHGYSVRPASLILNRSSRLTILARGNRCTTSCRDCRTSAPTSTVARCASLSPRSLSSVLSSLMTTDRSSFAPGSENRMRLPLEILAIMRETLPKNKSLWMRISATDWWPEGEKDDKGEWISWGIEQSKVRCFAGAKSPERYETDSGRTRHASAGLCQGGHQARRRSRRRLVRRQHAQAEDLCRPGLPGLSLPRLARFSVRDLTLALFRRSQVPFAEQIRASLGDEEKIPISSVGLITNGPQAEEILQAGKADVVRLLPSLPSLFQARTDLVDAHLAPHDRSAPPGSSSGTRRSSSIGRRSSASSSTSPSSTSAPTRA